MSNQASEDELIDDVLTNAIDYYISGNGVQPEAISRVKALIRTEKLQALRYIQRELTNSPKEDWLGTLGEAIDNLKQELE